MGWRLLKTYKKLLTALASGVLIIGTVIPACACGSVFDSFLIFTGVNLEDAAPEKAKAAFLTKVPIGIPEAEFKKILDKNFGRKDLSKYCRETDDRLSCRFPAGSLLWRKGIRIEAQFNGDKRLKDVEVGTYRSIFF